MPFTPDQPYPKKQGDNIRSKDWNDAVEEIKRLDTAKLNLAGGNMTGPLNVLGNVGIGTTTPDASLVVQGGGGTYIKAVSSGGQALLVGADPAGGIVSTVSNHDLDLRAGGNNTKVKIKANGNVGIGINDPLCKLDVAGAANVWADQRFAVPGNFMAPGSLTIGSTTRNYGGGTAWNNNTAGLLLEAQDSTEIAVHDSGTRVVSLMHYEGAQNRLTVGRDMGWGTPSVIQLNGKVGIGADPGAARLLVAGIGSWNTGLQLTGGSSTGIGLAIENTVAGGHRYVLISGSSGNGVGMNGGFGLYDDTANLYRFVVDANGQLGVGVANPDFRLDVQGRIRLRKGTDASAGLWLSQNPDTTNRAFIGLVDDNHVGFWGNAGANWAFHMNTATGYMRMLATSNPINFTSVWQASPDSVTNVAEICNDTNNHRVLMIVGNRATNGPRRVGIWDQLFVQGSLVAGSDLRRKEDIAPLSDSLSGVLALRGVRFRWRSPGGDAAPTFGLIAQEVEEVFPELVETGPDGMKALNYQGLLGPLVEAIKQQQAEISELRAEVQSLKAGREN